MNRSEFREFCLARPVLLDGATGTELQQRGLPAGVSPELWACEHPDTLAAIAAAYRAAGSDIIYACTFGGNRAKLEEFSLGEQLAEINRRAVEIAKTSGALTAGDLGPTGKLIEPSGDFPFEAAVEIFREQAQALIGAGADLIVIETMLDLQEARAAVIAVREISAAIPVMVSMTFGDDGKTLTGTPPLAALVTLQALGADAFGFNCSVGPGEMVEWLRAIKPFATIPLLAKPNAGAPRLIDGKTVFPMAADEYASHFPALIAAGANLVGCCCGSSPQHLAAAARAIKNLPVSPPARAAIGAAASMRETVFIGGGAAFAIIGERINPTGKKKLQSELREKQFGIIRQFAREQTRGGAAILDVNVGAAGVDEKFLLIEAVKILSPLTACPLCLDTADAAAMEAALRIYPGRALLNSISAEKSRLEKMLPLAKKYGALAVILPVTDSGVPETLAARQEVAQNLIDRALAFGLNRADLLIDGLAMTVSSSPDAPLITADFIEWCARELRVATTVGLSNVSFGMPARENLNLAFLGMLIGRGLTAALINPNVETMVDFVRAADALYRRDQNFNRYLQRFGTTAPVNSATAAAEKSPLEIVRDCVLNGDESAIAAAITRALDQNIPAQKLVDDALLPAINQVGDWFEKKIYFLPQLMLSAAAMRRGFTILEPQLAQNAAPADSRKKIILATVKGDIHDIGKNIVALLLRNYGFFVVDLGKDVGAEIIVETARREKISLVGLSALMTTTMVEMPRVIEYARQNGGGHLKFMVGGAAVDAAFAQEIGAHYSTDAVGAVKLAQSLLEN